MTLGELLGIQHKQQSMTLKELKTALQTASSLPVLAKNAEVKAAITAALLAIEAYLLIVEICDVIKEVTPKIKMATKAAAIPLNPAMASEVAMDGLMEAQKKLMEEKVTLIRKAKTAVLDIEIPGT